MHPLGLSGAWRIVAGLFLGILFAMVFIRSGAAWYSSISRLLKNRDTAFLRIFFISSAAGILFFHLAEHLEIVNCQFRPGFFWGAAAGGVIFGAGIVVCCHFPSTAMTSLAAGRLFSLWTILGFLAGMGAVSSVSGYLSDTVYKWKTPFYFHDKLAGYLSKQQLIIWVPLVLVLVSIILLYTDSSENTE